MSFAPDPEDPFPAILPMIGKMGSFSSPDAGLDRPLDCYLHGYVSSRIMNLARTSTERVPVCIAATKVDGLVLALTPNSHSYNYRSAVVHGYANEVTDDNEKLWALELVTNGVVPDRWANTRVPPNKTEWTSTTILRVSIVDGSAKIRSGSSHDDRKDMRDQSITSRVWTGVVPVWDMFGNPIPSPYNQVNDVPTHITSYVTGKNEKNSAQAVNATAEEE